MEIDVGNNKVYQTLNEAIDVAKEVTEPVTIKLAKGFVMQEQVLLYNEDLRHVTIEAEKEILIEAKYLTECIRVIMSPEFEVRPAFYGFRSKMPIIDALFKMEVPDDKYNCVDCLERQASGFLLDNSTIKFLPDAGVTHSPFINLCLINGSHATADYGVFDHAGNRESLTADNIDDAYGDGVRVNNSSFQGSYATTHRCGDMGFHFTQGARGNINHAESIGTGHHCLQATTASIVSARNGVFTDCIDDCVVAYASSNIDLRYGDTSRAELNFGCIATRTSVINFQDGVSNDCGTHGIMSNRGSTIDATNAKINNTKGHGIHASNGSTLNATNTEISGSGGDGIHCTHGSVIQARKAKVTGSGRDGILAYSAEVYAEGCTVNNSNRRNILATRGGKVAVNDSNLDVAGDKGILAYGSEVFANNSTVRNINGRAVEATQGGIIKAYGVDASGNADWGFAIYNGSTIYAVGSTGEANRDVNEITEHGMIIK